MTVPPHSVRFGSDPEKGFEPGEREAGALPYSGGVGAGGVGAGGASASAGTGAPVVAGANAEGVAGAGVDDKALADAVARALSGESGVDASPKVDATLTDASAESDAAPTDAAAKIDAAENDTSGADAAPQKRAKKDSKSAKKPKKPAKKAGWGLPIIAVVLAVLGASIFFYPQAAQWVNQIRQSKIATAYQALKSELKPDEHTQVREAKRYNELLGSGSLVDIDGRIPAIRDARATQGTEANGIAPYERQLRLNESGLMGRVRVPVAEVDIPIYHGTSDEVLSRGAGHLQGTALPVGGDSTRTVVTAHRGMAEATMFTHLDRVKAGDEFTLEVFGEVLVYRVFDIRVVAPDKSDVVKMVPGRDLATLITCTPLGINSHRIIVTGERVTPTPERAIEEAGKPSGLPGFPWFFVWWLLTVIGSGGFLFWMLRPPARCFLSVAPSILAGLGGILARLDVGVYAGNGYSIGANHVWESKLSALAAQKAELIGKYRSRRGVRRRIKRGKPLKNNPAITRITPRNLRSSRRSRNHD